MCARCETPATPLAPTEFLNTLPYDPAYKTRRGCLWLAYVAAQPAGTLPPVGKHTFYRMVRNRAEVREVRREDGTYVLGVSPHVAPSRGDDGFGC